MEPKDLPWVAVKDVCSAYGVGFAAAKNQISAGTFPVKTYKVGKKHVIDKEVHAEFFQKQREAGLLDLETTKR